MPKTRPPYDPEFRQRILELLPSGRTLKSLSEEYGFLGAMINGSMNGTYLDDTRYRPFWKFVNDNKLPVYLHPANPAEQPRVLEGFKVLQGEVWGWTTDNLVPSSYIPGSSSPDLYSPSSAERPRLYPCPTLL